MPLSVRLAMFGALAAAPLSAQAFVPLDPRDQACAPGSTPLLILGSYHMDNPGQDAVNLAVDDPRSPERQRQVGELLDLLQRFQPTVVALEAVYGRSAWLTRYQEYLKGNYTLGKNEIELIGFQLAKRQGLPAVAAVDYPMWMDGRTPDEIDYDWTPPQPSAPASAAPPSRAAPSAEETLLRRSTVVEYLRHLNGEGYMTADYATYMSFLRPDTTSNAPFAYTNALTNWYKRNFRIFTNLYRVSRPDDRILLLIGSGHLSILRGLAMASPDFCLVDTEAMLR